MSSYIILPYIFYNHLSNTGFCNSGAHSRKHRDTLDGMLVYDRAQSKRHCGRMSVHKRAHTSTSSGYRQTRIHLNLKENQSTYGKPM